MMTAFVWEFPLTLLFVVAVLRSGAWEKKERARERRGNVIWLQSAILSPEQLTQLDISKRKTVRTGYKYKLRIHVDVKIFLPKSFPLKFQRIRNDGKSISVDLWLYCIYIYRLYTIYTYVQQAYTELLEFHSAYGKLWIFFWTVNFPRQRLTLRMCDLN